MADEVHIKESRIGTFTAAASRHHMSPGEFASHVLANKEDFTPKMVKKAVFRHNFTGKKT